MKRFTLFALVALAACDRIDPNIGRPYRCAPGSDDQCPGGWHCGASGYCQDPAVATAYYCLTDSDCEGGWHCGAAGFCYDRSDAGAIACRADAGDCAPGWRCGLEQVCHSRSLAAPYECQSDPDCEQGWRCSPDSRCVDASGDALQPPRIDPSRWVLKSLDTSAAPSSPPQAIIGDSAIGTAMLWPRLAAGYSTTLILSEELDVDGGALTMPGDGNQEACAPVRGEPRWALRCPAEVVGDWQLGGTYAFETLAWRPNAFVNSSPVVASFEAANGVAYDRSSPTEAVLGWTAPTTDGGRALIAALRDRLWVADVTGLDPADAGSTLGGTVLEVIAFPSLNVAGFVPASATTDGGDAFLAGYVLASEELFRLDAAAIDRWRATQVSLPAGAPFSLWTDRDVRARVGFDDGVVISLPSRVPIGAALATSVQEYAQLCGDAFALTGNGLYRLELAADGGAIGAWNPTAPASLEALAASGAFIGGRLISTGREIYVFTATGAAYQLSVDGGCP